MNSLRALLRLLKNYRLSVLMNIGFNMLASVFSVFSLLMLIPFLQVLFYDTPPTFTFPEKTRFFTETLSSLWLKEIALHGKIRGLAWLCGALLLVFFLKNAFRYLALYALVPVRTGVMRDLRQQVFQKLLQLDLPFFQKNRRGQMLMVASQDVQEVEYGIIHFLETACKEPVTILLTLISLIVLSPTLTLWVALLLPVGALIIGRLGKKLKKESTAVQEKMGLLLSMKDDVLHGLKIIRLYHAAPLLTANYQKENNTYRELHSGLLWRKELASPLSEFLGIGIVAVLLWLGGQQVLSTERGLSPEVFITYIVVFSQIISPAKAFSNAWYFIQKGIASLERIQALLAEEITMKEMPNADNIDAIGDIEIRQLNFAYDSTPVLKNIDLKIKSGERVAIAGPSGCGKTTLVHLLCRLYPSPSDSIFSDGKAMENYSIKSWQENIAYVAQEPVLFYGTVRENVAAGDAQPDDAAILQALQKADALEFIDKLPGNLNAPIGDRGSKLSGGQQQRIALARAFYKNASLLILDEATSALDNQTDFHIQTALKNKSPEQTVIAIAHRLSSVKDYDRIVVMNQGEILATGTHAELMESCGLYRELVREG